MVILNAVIVDDEYHGRNNLSNLLREYCPEIKVTGTASSAAEAKEIILDSSPDVVFLDINMPKINGFEFLESFDDINFLTVIVSAHAEFGIQAIKANAVDYLLKPIGIKDLQHSVKKLIKLHKTQRINGINFDKLIIPHFQGYTIIDINEILRLEADNNYTDIILNGKKSITASKTLKEFEEMLPGNNFIRVHRSEIININYLSEYVYSDGGYAVMKDGAKVHISKNKVQALIEKIRNHTN